MGFFDKFKKIKKDEPQPIAPADLPKVKPTKTEATEVKASMPVKETKEKGKKPVLGVLLKPLITEKATTLTKFNQYVFMVSGEANKISVAQAIAGRYGVKPLAVNILNQLGKQVRHGRSTGKTKDWKKAIVTLPEGKTIQVQEGV